MNIPPVTPLFAGLYAVLVSSALSAQDLITGDQIAGMRICDPLPRVDSLFKSVRDTTIVGEDGEIGWPSKIVELTAGEWILFETSWVDTLRIWRASTNSPRFTTPNQVRVGSSLAYVVAAADSLAFHYPEGYLFITLLPEEISFQVDDSAAVDFWRRFAYGQDPLRVLSPSARIKEFTIGASCEARRQPPN